MAINKEILTQAATQARGIAIDGVVAAGNVGHLGMPLGAAEVGAALFGESLNFDPRLFPPGAHHRRGAGYQIMHVARCMK